MKVNFVSLDEKQLLFMLKNGNENCFEILYNRYSPRIYANIFKLVKSEEIALELLQDVFLKIWTKKETIDPEQSFRSYLFRIAENRVLDFFRKAARDKKLEAYLITTSTELYTHVEESIFQKENAVILRSAIELLPPQCKKVFTLCKLEGKSYEEASQILGISTSTISNQIVKGTRVIKEHYMVSQQSAIMLAAFFISSLN